MTTMAVRQHCASRQRCRFDPPAPGNAHCNRPAVLDVDHPLLVRKRADRHRRSDRLESALVEVRGELVERRGDHFAQLLLRNALADEQHRLGRNVLDLHLAPDIGRTWHELLLSFDDALQGREDLFRRRRELRHLRPVPNEPLARERGIAGPEDLPDLVERELEETSRLIASASATCSGAK